MDIFWKIFSIILFGDEIEKKVGNISWFDFEENKWITSDFGTNFRKLLKDAIKIGLTTPLYAIAPITLRMWVGPMSKINKAC